MYRVELAPAAQRQARRLAPDDARRIRDTLRALATEPRPAGSAKLAGFAAVWRVRTGRFRVIYEVHEDEQRVMVLRVARRDERTYRGL
ncbi:MAG: type II toxin-antitoxin system RelE/ParE family toxin [Chloroflexi bacterium]|nr:type II toxin-antitoxin system RelE/ParE family toxin [Chloroflexota bacterium]